MHLHIVLICTHLITECRANYCSVGLRLKWETG